MDNFIRSHRARVDCANQIVKTMPEKISIFDREAIVEFLLLEDVLKLLNHKLERERNRKTTSSGGEKSRLSNITTLTALIKVFTTAIEIAQGQIEIGEYQSVWSSINEHALMQGARGAKKNQKALKDVAVKMLKSLYEDAREAVGTSKALDDEIENLDVHEANVRAVRGIPTDDEFNAIINEVNAVFNDDIKVNSVKNNIDLA